MKPIHILSLAALCLPLATACAADSAVTVDTHPINLTTQHGHAISYTLNIGATGEATKNLGLRVSASGSEAFAISSKVDTGANKRTVGLTSSTDLAPGVYQGKISIQACASNDCSRQYAGSPFSIPYTLTVKK